MPRKNEPMDESPAVRPPSLPENKKKKEQSPSSARDESPAAMPPPQPGFEENPSSSSSLEESPPSSMAKPGDTSEKKRTDEDGIETAEEVPIAELKVRSWIIPLWVIAVAAVAAVLAISVAVYSASTSDNKNAYDSKDAYGNKNTARAAQPRDITFADMEDYLGGPPELTEAVFEQVQEHFVNSRTKGTRPIVLTVAGSTENSAAVRASAETLAKFMEDTINRGVDYRIDISHREVMSSGHDCDLPELLAKRKLVAKEPYMNLVVVDLNPLADWPQEKAQCLRSFREWIDGTIPVVRNAVYLFQVTYDEIPEDPSDMQSSMAKYLEPENDRGSATYMLSRLINSPGRVVMHG
jgi:hypothetical protein